MSFATDEEIRAAHEILLKGKKPFDEQRVRIIKSDNSCYVQACPGSGKTTALLAKLIILANRMPLPEGKGVCVLTHTNVAINEIKAKVGLKAEALFHYPNFFGTIQSFLHKYVTAAALHYFYGSQIEYVDDDVAKAVLLKKYSKLPFENKLKKLVYAHISCKEHLVSNEEVNAWGGEDTLIAAKVIKRKGVRVVKYDFQLSGYDLENVPRNVRNQIYAKRNSILDNQWKEIVLAFRVDWANGQVVTDTSPIGMASESGAEFVKLKEEMFRDGILTFREAYDLAFRYIKEKGLDFRAFSEKRFQYLFIDEVQDCNKQQVALIQKLFADDKVIVQRFGDYCQAIYQGDGSDGADIVELKDDRVLYIRNSNRFGERIAKPLRTLCMEDNSVLVGNEDVYSAKPVIISYDNPLSVLPRFEGLLDSIRIPEMDNLSVLEIAKKEQEKDPLHRLNVKACGWVGKVGANSQKRFIESYFPAFERKKVKTRMEGEAFDDFIPKNKLDSVKDCASSIIQGVLKFLDLCNVNNSGRRYTRTSLLGFLTANDTHSRNEFLSNVMSWTLDAVKGNDVEVREVKNCIYQYLSEILLPLFGKDVTEEATAFFYADRGGYGDEQVTANGNVYHGQNIDVEVGTVHSVKGETHVATLYLETFYDGNHESERLADQFKGKAYVGNDNDVIKSLKVAYVGMSRPSYLLCVAMQKDRFEAIDCRELREIWDVKEA